MLPHDSAKKIFFKQNLDYCYVSNTKRKYVLNKVLWGENILKIA